MGDSQKIFVTGASGFIGSRLVNRLVAQGHQVCALSRREDYDPLPNFPDHEREPMRHPSVELVAGDLSDVESLVRGMEGCSGVYHMAGYAKNWAADDAVFFEANVQGTRNVLSAAVRQGVQRIVYTSTIMTLGPTPKGQVCDEDSPRMSEEFLTPYEESKTIAERETIAAAREQGVPVVVVNPTRVYGRGHLTEGNALALIVDDYDRGKAPIMLNRGVNVGNYVRVEDVVEGHLLAMQKGRIGERYILGGDNVSLKEFFQIVDRVSGKRHFTFPIFKPGALLFATIMKKRAEWFGKYPPITPGWVRTFLLEWAHSSDKAKRELGYDPIGLEEGTREMYHWLMEVRAMRERAAGK